MTRRNYSLSACEDLISRYCEAGGEITAAAEGCLGLGLIILEGPGLKSFVIRETYLNEWSSGHEILNYGSKPVPQKWYKEVDRLNSENN